MLDLVLEKGRTPIALFGWYEPAGAGNQLAQGKPASTHAANRTPSSFETHGANSTCSPGKKKGANSSSIQWRQTHHHSNNNTTSQITVNLGATNSPLAANPLQVHYT